MSMETRILPQNLSEVRVITNEAGKIHIPGRGIVFNQLSQNLGWFKEIIDPRALDEADMADIVSCFNHDMNIVLGRTTSGTLTYSISAVGVDYDILPPETSYVKDVVIAPIERKDVTGSSFMFTIAEKGDEWDYLPDGTIVRYVKKIAKVFEFGPVTMPAYTQTYTDVAKRSFESHQKTIEEAIKNTQVVENEYRSRYARLHLQLIGA